MSPLQGNAQFHSCRVYLIALAPQANQTIYGSFLPNVPYHVSAHRQWYSPKITNKLTTGILLKAIPAKGISKSFLGAIPARAFVRRMVLVIACGIVMMMVMASIAAMVMPATWNQITQITIR